MLTEVKSSVKVIVAEQKTSVNTQIEKR